MSLFEGLVAAVISAAVSVLVVSMNNRAERKRIADERDLNAKGELNLLREPLILAAKDLSDRIHNLQDKGFLHYIHGPDDYRHRIALLGTLYRFATYWAVQEQLYQRVNLLRFEEDPATKGTSDRLRAIAGCFASDRRNGTVAMMWRDEQRAVGQLMVKSEAAEQSAVLGFAEFLEIYEPKFSYWFSRFSADIQQPGIIDSNRLREAADLLDSLVADLKEARSLSKS